MSFLPPKPYDKDMQTTLNAIQHTIHSLAQHPVTLVAVTKYATLVQMEQAYHAGLRHFGENKVQDALHKQANLPPAIATGVTWHLIGHLQRNKVAKTVGKFALIHSVDSLALAYKIAEANTTVSKVQAILLQVNVANEATKEGFSIEALHQALPMLAMLPGLSLKGLMTIAPQGASPEQLNALFGSLAHLLKTCNTQYGLSMSDLSMGMSQDYTHALINGATIIRIGSQLFGGKP
jgi:PLP dependent protein